VLLGIFGLGYVGAGLFRARPDEWISTRNAHRPTEQRELAQLDAPGERQLGFLALIGACLFLPAVRDPGSARLDAYSVITGLWFWGDRRNLVRLAAGWRHHRLLPPGIFGLAWVSREPSPAVEFRASAVSEKRPQPHGP